MDMQFLTRAVIGGYGGSGRVVHCDPLKQPGMVRIEVTDAFGNEQAVTIPVSQWREALLEELSS